jgi:hypothetical protein
MPQSGWLKQQVPLAASVNGVKPGRENAVSYGGSQSSTEMHNDGRGGPEGWPVVPDTLRLGYWASSFGG